MRFRHEEAAGGTNDFFAFEKQVSASGASAGKQQIYKTFKKFHGFWI